MSHSTRVAVIGCGHWGKNLVRNFAELGALGAVVDPDAATTEKFATQYSVKALSFDEAIADADIDGVVIAAPAELHAPLAEQAFAAGKHVYVEKPMALTLADCETMAAAGKKAGRVLMVGHLLQYHPAFVTLKKAVDAGEIGELKYAYSNRRSLGKFRTEENVLWSFAPHDLSMLLSLFPQAPTSVQGRGGSYVTPGIEDEYTVDMEFASGARAQVNVSWMHPFKEQKLVVIGDKGMIVFEDSEADATRKLRLYPHTIDISGPVPVPQKADEILLDWPTEQEPLKQECQHFLDCCASGKTPRTDAAEAIEVIKVLLAAGK